MLKLQDRGIEYGLALLSRGSAGDWKRISEEQKTNLACQIFNFADKAGDGVVEKFDLYRCLVHGPVGCYNCLCSALPTHKGWLRGHFCVDAYCSFALPSPSTAGVFRCYASFVLKIAVSFETEKLYVIGGETSQMFRCS
uniref:EF-hand domain-containing protein n=1 Tax=Tetraselmis sp. GSL018 TaxID=582737 RepID=A0A061S426_9CHLO